MNYHPHLAILCLDLEMLFSALLQLAMFAAVPVVSVGLFVALAKLIREIRN